MAKNDLILLDGILDEYVAKGIPSEKRDEAFEYFVAEQILKDYAFTKDQLLSGSVDGRNDGGIDEFFVLVNGHLVENIPPNFWPKSHAELEIYFITCKHDSSFRQVPINTLIPSLIELFDFSISSSKLKSAYNERILRKRELLISTYKRLAPALVTFDIHLIYACRGDERIEENVQAKADQVVVICQEAFRDCTATFSFWGNSKLLTRYRKQLNQTLELKYGQCINQDGQYVVLTSLHDYCDFISDCNGNLNKHLFDSNVRDFLGLNPVNTDILNSLKNNHGPNFWWLNNGITIIGSKAHIVGNLISIDNVQIVNGLQTSESIFNYFTEFPAESDQRSLLIKILISDNAETNNAIIYATNNQTNVNVPALRATDKIQHDIETILKTYGFYYERRTNYYQNLGIAEKSIVSPLSLASGYVSLIYKNPYRASLLKQKFMRDNNKYEKIFSEKTDLRIWVSIAGLIKKTDEILIRIKPRVLIGKSTIKFLKNYRHVILFLTISRLMGTFAFGEKQLIDFDSSLLTEMEIEKTLIDIQEVSEKSFTYKLPHSFYSSCYRHAEKKYKIKGIRAIQKKNQEFSNDAFFNYSISEEFVEKVLVTLPAQPWSKNIHQNVADELGVKTIAVSNAISYLIYTGRVNAQIFGYVFDNEGNIIAEGNHYGHTDKEAKEKLKETLAFYERRFGF